MPYTGIDISGWQAGIPQSVTNQADVLIVKATEATNYVSPELYTQFVQGVSGNKKVGVYHFARPGNPVSQANYFVDQTYAQELYPDFWVLDFEDHAMLSDTEWPLSFMSQVKERTGQPVWFYCYMSPMKLYAYESVRNAGYKHWIAGYPFGQQNGFGPQMSLDDYITWSGLNSTGIDFAGWQYSAQGRLPGWGGDLDLNWFFDDAFTGETAIAPKVSTPSTSVDPLEAAISWFANREGRVSYSMDYRNGPSSYDCSSSVYFALIEAGILPQGRQIGNTETMFKELPEYGFELIGDSSNGEIPTQRGDIFIWGVPGQSAGSGGHTGIFVNSNDIIHCNYGYNGITTNNHDSIWSANGSPLVTIYRYKGSDLDMYSREDLDAIVQEAVKKALNEKIEKQGGAKGRTSVATEAAWTDANFKAIHAKLDNISRMVWLLNDTFRIGIPGVVKDGTLGAAVRRVLGYGSDQEAETNGGLPATRKARYEMASKNNWSWWT